MERTNQLTNTERKAYEWMVPGGDDHVYTFLKCQAGGSVDEYIKIYEDAHGDVAMNVIGYKELIEMIGMTEFNKIEEYLK